MKRRSILRRRLIVREVKRPELKPLKLKNLKSINDLKFDEKQLIPAIVQDYKKKDILMVAYMNKQSLKETLSTGLATYWSRSRNCLWLKGDTSGHFQIIKKMYYDCDKDTLLLEVRQIGVACHTGERSCFFTRMV
ncbi:MAG: phosphoribosyl-AMP cyclohydrolase [Candidatus Omnitrophica bacterium]|nr:phosphoribosyl-AMP cyclohydrolase [Candidatus Omnitrophota bacterium]